MQYVTFFPRDASGNILPQGTTVAVYLTGTTNLAPLYDYKGNAISNPITTGGARTASFAAADGVYDIAQSSGATLNTLTKQNLKDALPDLLQLETRSSSKGQAPAYLYKKATSSDSGWLAPIVPNSEGEPGFNVLSPIGEAAASFASQTADNPSAGSEGCQGASFFAINNNSSAPQTAYGWYAEARRYSGAGTTQGFESNITNLGSVTDLTPAGAPSGVISVAGWFSSGRPDVSGSEPSSAVAGIVNNTANGSAPFRRGFVFLDGSLDTSVGEALSMPTNVGVAWYNGSAQGALIKSVAYNSKRSSLNFYSTDDAGNNFGFSVNGSVNDSMTPNVDVSLNLGDPSLRFRSTYSVNFCPGAGATIWTSGAGNPNGAVTAPVGSLYTNTSGGAGSTLYVKESGSGNTGWTAK